MGADLVCGAKYIGGPNSSGILCGKKALVDAAAKQGFIGFDMATNGKAFGRPLKLDRQEIIAVVVALQEWMAMDHERRLANLDRGSRPSGASLGLRREPRIPPAGRRLPASCACRSIPRPRSGAPRRSSPGLREGSPAIYTGVEGRTCSTPPASGKARKRSSRGASARCGEGSALSLVIKSAARLDR